MTTCRKLQKLFKTSGHRAVTAGLFVTGLLSSPGQGLAGQAGSPAPEGGGRVRVALDSEPKTLDPRHATDANGMRLVDLIFESLVRVDSEGRVQGMAAKKWSCQKTHCTFHLRNNIVFSNGHKLNAEDIRFSFQEYQSPKSPFASAFRVIQSVKVKNRGNSLSIHISFREAAPGFLASDLPVLKLLPKKEVLKAGGRFYQNPVGSGGFKLKHQSPSSVVLQARRPSPPSGGVKEVVFQIIRDDLTRYQKTLSREIDIAQGVLPFEKIKSFQNNKDFKVFRTLSPSVTYLLIHFKDPCLSQKQVRKALAMSLHPQALITHKLKGFARQALTLLTPDHPFFNTQLKKNTYDPRAANQGFKLLPPACRLKEFSLKTASGRATLRQARVLAHQIRGSGFKIRMENFEWGTFYTDLSRGNFHIALLKWVGVVDPDIYRMAFHSREHPPRGRNRGLYTHPALDRLLEQGKKTFPFRERKLIYDQVQKILQEDIAFVPLWHEESVSVVKNSILNYRLSKRGDFWFLHHIRLKP